MRNYMKKILLPIAMLTLTFSCDKAQQEDKQKKLIDEVMAIHDEVMPKMEEIMTLKSELDSVAKVSADSVQAKELISALDSADIKMSVWMEEYNPEAVKEKGSDEVIKYFEGEKKRISEVKELTNTSITKAKQFLEK